MTAPSLSIAIQRVLTTATSALQTGNLMAAEIALVPFLSGKLPHDPNFLNTAGTWRMPQGRLDEAAGLFDKAAKRVPREPIFAFNLGLSLSRAGRNEEAE